MSDPERSDTDLARNRRRVARNHERGGWLGMALVLILCLVAAFKFHCSGK
jgi:hypothetical protein